MASQKKEMPPDTLPLNLEDVSAGLPQVQGKELPDKLDNLEVFSVEDERKRQEIENLKSDRRLREKYADRILRFLEVYAGTVALFIILHGFELFGFSMPNEVLITLVGSTAVAAIGLVGFIAKGLFDKNH